MSYLVLCTFTLRDATPQDYQNAYTDLEDLGLKRMIISTEGPPILAPTSSVMGELDGAGATSVRDDVRNRVQTAFRHRGFKSEVSVVVGGDWAWGSATT